MKNFVYLISTLAIIIISAFTMKAEPIVLIHTTEGDVKVRLYDDTPKHRDNFLKLAREHYYDGLLFHRVIKDFMVQTGDPNSRNADSTAMLGAGSPDYTIEAEIEYPRHFHKYGALAAARTGDQVNPQRRSSGSQFYIVTGQVYTPAEVKARGEQDLMQRRQAHFRQLVQQHQDEIKNLQNAGDSAHLEALRQQLIKETEEAVTPLVTDEILNAYSTVGGTPHLDGQYTVFGEVIEGMDTVEKIQNAETGRSDRPKSDIRIISMEILNDK